MKAALFVLRFGELSGFGEVTQLASLRLAICSGLAP